MINRGEFMAKTKCPNCNSYGLSLVRRSALRRVLGWDNKRRCIDCGTVFTLNEARKRAMNNGQVAN